MEKSGMEGAEEKAIEMPASGMMEGEMMKPSETMGQEESGTMQKSGMEKGPEEKPVEMPASGMMEEGK